MSAFNLKDLKPKKIADASDKLKNISFLAPDDRERLQKSSTTSGMEAKELRATEIVSVVQARQEDLGQGTDQNASAAVSEPQAVPIQAKMKRRKSWKIDRIYTQIHLPVDLHTKISTMALQQRRHRNRVIEDMLRKALAQ